MELRYPRGTSRKAANQANRPKASGGIPVRERTARAPRRTGASLNINGRPELMTRRSWSSPNGQRMGE